MSKVRLGVVPLLDARRCQRSVPVVLVASEDAAAAEEIAATLRQQDAVVYTAHSDGGCLRVATSLGPDVIVLDPRLPGRLRKLLAGHPKTAQAQIVFLSVDERVEATEPTMAPKPEAA